MSVIFADEERLSGKQAGEERRCLQASRSGVRCGQQHSGGLFPQLPVIILGDGQPAEMTDPDSGIAPDVITALAGPDTERQILAEADQRRKEVIEPAIDIGKNPGLHQDSAESAAFHLEDGIRRIVVIGFTDRFVVFKTGF